MPPSEDTRPFLEIIPATLAIPITLLFTIMGFVSWRVLNSVVPEPSEIII